jgi:hypothetical protein
MDWIRQLIGRQPPHLRLLRSDERTRIIARGEGSGGLVNGRPDSRIGAAAAQVAAHPRVDLRIVGRRVRLE